MKDALAHFMEGLPGGARILDLSSPGSPEHRRMKGAGFLPDVPAAPDLRLLSLRPASWDAAWCDRALEGLLPTEIQRILIAVFQGLRPGGRLFFSCASGTLSRDALGALLRQSGFRLLLEGQPQGEPGVTGFLAARI
jgi:hypothetical protein